MQTLISVTASTFNLDARQAAKAARELGFGGLLFDAYSKALSFSELSVTGRREFRQVMAGQAMQIVGLQGDLGPNGLGPGADLDRIIDRIDPALEAAAGLSAPLLCLDVGPLADPPRARKQQSKITPDQAGLLILPALDDHASSPPPPPPPVNQPLLDSVNTALAEIGRRADRFGVMVALRSTLASVAALENAIVTARCPWFGVDLDSVAVATDDWPGDEIFSRLGGFIRHVRARDALIGDNRRCKPAGIGQGSVNWRDLLSRLDQSGFASWVTIDPTELPDRVGYAVAGLEKLRSL